MAGNDATAFSWGEKLLDVTLGAVPGLASLVPPHLLRQAQARLSDLNPLRGIAANEDLLRALRLAWTEAAQEVGHVVSSQVCLLEWQPQAEDLRRFAALTTVEHGARIDRRHAARRARARREAGPAARPAA